VASNLPEPAVFKFAAFELDLRAGELFKGGSRIRLQQQPANVLAILLEQPGQVVTREELRKRIWPADTFVDFDHGLNAAIKKLRQALCDEPKKPRFIETLPRKGYRFIAPVEKKAAVSRPVDASEANWVGGTFQLQSDAGSHYVLMPVDEESMKEKDRLEAVKDDLGVSLLVGSGKVLLLACGTRVKVLDARPTPATFEARILEGEHVGVTVLAEEKYLRPST
jgi:DNA-binding winged helix-turn-helix (wHTH) protein